MRALLTILALGAALAGCRNYQTFDRQAAHAAIEAHGFRGIILLDVRDPTSLAPCADFEAMQGRTVILGVVCRRGGAVADYYDVTFTPSPAPPELDDVQQGLTAPAARDR